MPSTSLAVDFGDQHESCPVRAEGASYAAFEAVRDQVVREVCKG